MSKKDNTAAERNARMRQRRKVELEYLKSLFEGISELISANANDEKLANFCKSYLNLKKES